ncbi:MAG: Hint domain-containing protein, partial [Devosiaceae bacterium]|nr:Hint domain-containing protein [Devosiaceae bacterium]
MPTEYNGPFVTFGAQFLLGLSVSYVPGQQSVVPASVSVLAGPQMKLQLPANMQGFFRVGDEAETTPQSTTAAEMGAFLGSQFAIYNNAQQNTGDFDQCFPAGTKIRLADGDTAPIEALQPGDAVVAFDGKLFNGRGELSGKKVVRLFENITDTWIKLSNDIVVTPGHHFLDSKGKFRSIDAILDSDGIIINEDGIEQVVTGEYIHYSAETANMFEQSEGYVAQSVGEMALAVSGGGLSLPRAGGVTHTKGWKTYNFEVEGFHTYVAGGIRVHNHSIKDPTQTTLQNNILSSDGSGPIIPNGVQITGSGAVVTLASGSTASAGTIFNPGNGSTYQVNNDGSTTNLNTGNTYGGSSGSSESQTNGSGPSVTLASGSVANAGTTFDPGNGYTYRVNNDGSVTNLDTGRTTGASTNNNNNNNNNNDSGGGGGGNGKPVLLDLDGDGIEIVPLTSSNFFFDMNGDGKQNRTAWAGNGDGVLVRDEGNDGIIDQKQEVDFTSWAPSAKSDLEALRMAFDSNDDGKLSAADDDWSLFKVLVSNSDGSTILKTLTELGITSIDLISNNQEVL